MFCIKCGGQIPPGALVCPNCGTPVQSAAPNVQNAQPQTAQFSGASVPSQQTMAPSAIAGFVCSALGMVTILLPFVNLALSIIGTSLCKKSLKAIHENPAAYTGNSLVTIGHVLGIIGIVINSIIVLITIVWGIVMGEGLFAITQLL